MPSDLLSTGEAARLLGCSEAHIRALANRGTLSCQTTPLGRLFARTDVEALRETRADRI